MLKRLYVSLILFSLACPVLTAQTTLLIDYDDGDPDNGIHQASLRNGGFEEADGTNFQSTPFWDSYFAEGEETDATLTSNPHTGNLRSFATGFQGSGTRTQPAQTIPSSAWTIEEGDVFFVSLWAREGTRFDANDMAQILLHVVDDSGNPVNDSANTPDRGDDRLLQFNADIPDDNSYALISAVSEPVAAGSPWIGNQIQLRILNSGSRNEFLIIDDVTLSAARLVEEPASAVARYRADGDTLNALTNANHGTAEGDLSYGPGFGVGQSFSGNGTNAAVAIPHLIPDSFSITFWMKTATPGASGSALQWWEGDGLVDGEVMGQFNDFGVSLRGHHVAFGVGDASGATRSLFSQTAVTDNRWHHVAVTRVSLSGAMQLFVDGRLEATGTGPVGPRLGPPGLRIGALQSEVHFFDGLIDDVQLFQGILSPSEIDSIYVTDGDTDGDGQLDPAEFEAGTDWGDSNDVFRVTLEAPAQPAVDGRQGRRYRFYRSPELNPIAWQEFSVTTVLETNATVSVMDPEAPQDQAYYRASVEQTTPDRPNILVIVTDDQGYADLSAFPHAASDVYTPHMDRLADRGVLFTQAYVTGPVCSASRAGWNTGRYQQEWNPGAGWTPGLPTTVPTIAELLRTEGYVTCKIGKNDYGTTLSSPNNFSVHTYPAHHGFDKFLGFTAHAHDYWFHEEGGNNVNNSSAHAGPFQGHDFLVMPNQNPGRHSFTNGYYLTDLLTDQALDFIQGQTNRTDPFFLTLSYNSVHHLTPEVPQEWLDIEAARLGWTTTPPAAPIYDPNTDTTQNPSSYSAYYQYWNKVGNVGNDDMRKYYLANLRSMDANIGRLLDQLDSQGLAGNTLILLFGDNGGPPETGADNRPLTGSKYNLWEGGIRVPFLMSWPSRIPQGILYTNLVSTLDVTPTCLQAAYTPLAANLRGHSLIQPVTTGQPVVAGDTPGEDARVLFWKWQGANWAVRKGPYKLVRTGTNRSGTFTSQMVFYPGLENTLSLFDLDANPREEPARNLVSDPAFDAIQSELQQLYDAWFGSL